MFINSTQCLCGFNYAMHSPLAPKTHYFSRKPNDFQLLLASTSFLITKKFKWHKIHLSNSFLHLKTSSIPSYTLFFNMPIYTVFHLCCSFLISLLFSIFRSSFYLQIYQIICCFEFWKRIRVLSFHLNFVILFLNFLNIYCRCQPILLFLSPVHTAAPPFLCFIISHSS